MGLSSTTTRSGACAKRLEMPGVLGLPPGVFARPNRAGVLAAPGVFAREGVLAFCHETGIDAANVLRDDGVLASAAFDASSIVGSVMPNGGRLQGAYRCGRDAGASGAVEAAFVAKFIAQHNGRDEKKTHKKFRLQPTTCPFWPICSTPSRQKSAPGSVDGRRTVDQSTRARIERRIRDGRGETRGDRGALRRGRHRRCDRRGPAQEGWRGGRRGGRGWRAEEEGARRVHRAQLHGRRAREGGDRGQSRNPTETDTNQPTQITPRD